LENVSERGRIIFCQLDVSGRTVEDPVAERIVAGLIEYMGRDVSPKRPPALSEKTPYQLHLGLDAAAIAKVSPVPLTVVSTNAYFTRIEPENMPPELAGLSNADWAWHGAMEFDAILGEYALSPSLAIVPDGDNKIVFWQVPPDKIDEVKYPYLRTTKRRANAMLSRLIYNLEGERPREPARGDACPPEWGKSLYHDTPIADDNPYRYYRW